MPVVLFLLSLPAGLLPAAPPRGAAGLDYTIVQEDQAVPPPPSPTAGVPAGPMQTSTVPQSPAPPPPVPAPSAALPPSEPPVLEHHRPLVREADQPWTLPQPHWLEQRGIVLGGWLQHGITFNGRRNPTRFNGPVAANDLDGEYQMNQLWLYLSRPVDTGGYGWDLGGHIDMIYGSDWRFGINEGLEDRINGLNDQTYGLVLPQFYLEVGYNNLSVKLGHFAGILDYEAIPAPLNPFYSHSYSYGYTVPQLVTGVLSEWQMTEQVALQAGVHRGWMQFESFNSSWDVMAGIRWNSLDERTSLAYALSSGKQSFRLVDAPDSDNRFVYSLVVQRQLTDPLRYVLVHNLGYEKNNPLIGGEDATWYGLNNYLLYQINPRWSANLRAEWMRDNDGARIAGPGNIDGVTAWEGAGYAGNFYNLTAGLNWRAHPNILFRPEMRYDWYSGEESEKTGNELPFGAGDRSDQLLFAIDMVVTY